MIDSLQLAAAELAKRDTVYIIRETISSKTLMKTDFFTSYHVLITLIIVALVLVGFIIPLILFFSQRSFLRKHEDRVGEQMQFVTDNFRSALRATFDPFKADLLAEIAKHPTISTAPAAKDQGFDSSAYTIKKEPLTPVEVKSSSATPAAPVSKQPAPSKSVQNLTIKSSGKSSKRIAPTVSGTTNRAFEEDKAGVKKMPKARILDEDTEAPASNEENIEN